MKEIKREFLKEVRLDGSETYIASVTFEMKKIFFGLFTITKKMYLYKAFMEERYLLIDQKQNAGSIATLERAKYGLEQAIRKEISSFNYGKITKTEIVVV